MTVIFVSWAKSLEADQDHHPLLSPQKTRLQNCSDLTSHHTLVGQSQEGHDFMTVGQSVSQEEKEGS